jgi:hypothetical protein
VSVPDRFVVVTGGRPSDEELAALVVALTPSAPHEPSERPVPAWSRAALLEGTGSLAITRPADLERDAL